MGSPDTHITRITRTLSAVTSQIFRCQGLLRPSADADRLGTHDLAYWLIFVSLLSGWFLFIFAPQRERLENLQGRALMLKNHLAAEKRELKRMERSVDELQRGDPRAWERAARTRLGWVEPGEVVDIAAWLPRRQYMAPVELRQQGLLPQIPNLTPRPNVPTLPSAPPNIRRLASTRTPALDLLGPSVGTPPQPPAASRVVQMHPRMTVVTNRNTNMAR